MTPTLRKFRGGPVQANLGGASLETFSGEGQLKKSPCINSRYWDIVKHKISQQEVLWCLKVTVVSTWQDEMCLVEKQFIVDVAAGLWIIITHKTYPCLCLHILSAEHLLHCPVTIALILWIVHETGRVRRYIFCQSKLYYCRGSKLFWPSMLSHEQSL